jgi:hypothetical protein
MSALGQPFAHRETLPVPSASVNPSPLAEIGFGQAVEL